MTIFHTLHREVIYSEVIVNNTSVDIVDEWMSSKLKKIISKHLLSS